MGGGYFKACFSFVARCDNAVTGVARGCGLNCSQTRAGRVRGSTFVRLGAAVEERVGTCQYCECTCDIAIKYKSGQNYVTI